MSFPLRCLDDVAVGFRVAGLCLTANVMLHQELILSASTGSWLDAASTVYLEEYMMKKDYT